MELNRLARVLRARWLIVVLMALVGFFSAFGFTYLSNRSVDERWEVLIPLRFEIQENETLDDLTARIDDTRGQAVIAAQELLAEYEGASIFADTATGRLFFSAEANTEEVARERAENLLSAYVSTDQGGGDIDAQLEALAANAEEVAAEIEALETALTPQEQALAARHQVLDASIAGVSEQLVALTVADAGASETERLENEEAREDLEEILNDLLADKAALDPAPTTGLSASEQLELDSLNRQLELIGLEYQRLSLRTVGVLAENAQQELPIVNPLTPTPSSPMTNGLIGLIGGAGLAMFALVFVTRSRKEVWLTEDLPVPVLGEVPHRKVTTLPGPAWYDTAPGGRRKEAIQTTRTAIEGAVGHESASLAIIGDSVGATATHALAVDLAASFASAGRSVLLIGADFSTPIEMTEFEVGRPTLSTVLSTPIGSSGSLDDALSRIVLEAVNIRTDLAVLPAGEPPDSPADALAGQQFRQFIAIARDYFDLVVAVGGEAESASSQVLTQRLGAAVVAVGPGKTTVPRIDNVMLDMTQQRIQIPGAVMLYGSDSRLTPRLPRLSTRSGPTAAPRREDSVSRLGFYPFPGSKRSVTPTDGSLDHLAEGLAQGKHEVPQPEPRDERDPIASEVLDALENTDAGRAFDPVAEYVVARVEDMMTAVPGQANVSQEMVDIATDLAFVPLTPIRGVPTTWDRLVSELVNEVGDVLGRRLASKIGEVLTTDADIESHSVDQWLEREFFRRHLLRTDREPTVWHVASAKGALHVLVNGRRLTDERIARMTTDVVRRRINDLEQELKDLRLAGDEEAAESLDADLKDVRLFEVSLSALRGGTRDEARLVYPWRKHDRMPRGWNPIWSEGVRPNIAPLQKLELLPEPVLTDDELDELVPTG